MRRWWCFYDGSCPICQALVARFGSTLRRMGGRSCSLQASPLAHYLSPEELMRELRVWDGHGLHGGAQAIAWMAGRCWFLIPLPYLLRMPGIHSLANRAYQAIAQRRHCLIDGSTCAIPGSDHNHKPQ